MTAYDWEEKEMGRMVRKAKKDTGRETETLGKEQEGWRQAFCWQRN